MNQGVYDLRRDVDRIKNKTDEIAKDYYLQVDVPIVTYQNETYTPSYVSATSYVSNHDLTDFFDGHIVLYSSTDGFIEDKTYVSYTDGHTLSHTIDSTNITNYLFELYDENWGFLDKQSVTIVRTTKGGTGKGYDFIYYTTEKTELVEADYPINGQDYTKLVGNFNEWLQRPHDVDANHPHIFMSFRTTDDNEEWGNWSKPVKYSGIGERGEDGEGLEMIFCRTQYADDYPIDPSTLDPVQTDDYYPDGWSDDQQGVDSTYCFEYVCMRTKTTDNSKIATWNKFSPPKLWASYGQDGEDGKGIEFIFRRNNDPTSAPTFRGTGDQRQDKKTYTGTDPNGRHFYDDDYVPYDWTDNQMGVDENNQVEWVAKRVKKVTNGVANWESYSSPQVWANWSEDGADSVNVSLGNEAQLIPVDSEGSLKGGSFTITIPVYCYKGLNRIAGSIDISSITTSGDYTPFSAKSSSNPTASSDGSVVLTCSKVPTRVSNNEQIKVTVNGKIYTKVFSWAKIGDGADGNEGGTYDFVYYTTDTYTTPTINTSTVIENNPNRVLKKKWCARPSDPTEQYPYCFGAYIKKVNGVISGSYSDVYLWSKYGERGASGTSHQYAYYTTSSTTPPAKPTGDVTATSGLNKWTTVPVAMDTTNKYMYISYRINDGTWSNTALWSKFGEDGQSITDVLNYYASTRAYDNGTSSDYNNLFTDMSGVTRGSEYTTVNRTTQNYTSRIPINSGMTFEIEIVGVTKGKLQVGRYESGKSNTYHSIGLSVGKFTIENLQDSIVFKKNGTVIQTITNPPKTETALFFIPEDNSINLKYKNLKIYSSCPAWNTEITQVPFNSTYKNLWSKEVTKAGNNVVGETTPIMIAEYGKGGQSISSITEEYILSRDTTQSSMVGSWSPTPPTMTATNKYLWNRETINYSNPTSSQTSTPKIIGAYGDKGDTGAKGKDGKGLEHIFYLSDTEIDWNTNDNLYNDTVTTDTSSKYSKTNCTLSFNTNRLIMTRTVSEGSSYIDLRIESPQVLSKYLGKRVRFECDIVSATAGCFIHIYQLINGTYSGSGNSASTTSGHLSKEYVIDKNATRILFRIIGTNTGLNGTCSFRNFKVSSFTDPTKWDTTGDFQNDDYVRPNTGWTDDATGVDATNKYEYCAIRTKTVPTGESDGVWNGFETPSMWAKFGDDGEDGEDGADGQGLEMIFRRTSNDKSPIFKNNQDKKSYTGTVNGKHFYDDDYVPENWTDNPQGVDGTYLYEWVSMRTKTIDDEGNGEWQSFNAPSIWAKFGQQGSQGLQGLKGDKGRDGTELTGDEIMTLIEGQNIDSQSVGGILPNEILTTKLQDTKLIWDSSKHGYVRIYKMGRLIVFTIADFQFYTSSTTTNQTVFTVPEWARPNVTGAISTTTQPTPVSNPSYPQIKYQLNFSAITSVDPSTLEIGDIIRYSNYFYRINYVDKNYQVISLDERVETVPKIYFPNVPTGEAFSITEDGLFRFSPTSTGTRQLSGTICYIATESTRYEVTLSAVSTSIATGTELKINANANSTQLKNVPLKIVLNNQTYTRNTGDSGQASLKINLPAGTYATRVEFGGNATYKPKTYTFTLTVRPQTTTPTITQMDNYSARITINNNPVVNLNCKIVIDNQTFYQNTDYNGHLDMSGILMNFRKVNYSASISTNNTNICPVRTVTMTLTGLKNISTYTKTLTPSATEGNLNSNYSEKDGTGWNYATTGALANKNDGSYAITDILSSGSTAGVLKVKFTTDLPSNAVVKKVQVFTRYASLLGWVGESKGSYNTNESKIRIYKTNSETALTGLTEKNYVTSTIARTQCDTWYEVGYEWTGLSISASDFANPYVWIWNIKNSGGGYGNNSRFGIDFVQMVVEYDA